MGWLSHSLFYVATIIPYVLSKDCHHIAVRREWGSLSDGERAEWIDAVKCLGRLPHSEALKPSVDVSISQIPPVDPASSYYDDFVYVHMDLNRKIHNTAQFLPWHRAHVHAFETSLKLKCNYTGTQPYWDWTANTEDYFNNLVFSSSSTTGFGGNGDPKNDFQITNGAFAEGFQRFYPASNAIRRNLTKYFPSSSKPITWSINATAIETLVSGHVGDFVGFQDYLENHQGAHGAVHLSINGDMIGTCPENAPKDCVGGPKWSANDPLFYMHHSMVDRVWYLWQRRNPENFWAFRGGSVSYPNNTAQYPNGGPPYLTLDSIVPSDGMFEEWSIREMMNTTDGPLCYVYG